VEAPESRITLNMTDRDENDFTEATKRVLAQHIGCGPKLGLEAEIGAGAVAFCGGGLLCFLCHCSFLGRILAKRRRFAKRLWRLAAQGPDGPIQWRLIFIDICHYCGYKLAPNLAR